MSLNSLLSLLNSSADLALRLNIMTACGGCCRSALHSVVGFADDRAAVRALVEAKANMEAKDDRGRTPIDYAEIRQRTSLVEEMVAAGGAAAEAPGEAPGEGGYIAELASAGIVPAVQDLHTYEAPHYVGRYVHRGSLLDLPIDLPCRAKARRQPSNI